MAQADDGIQIRGAVGRVVAEEKADADRHADAERDPEGRYDSGDGGEERPHGEGDEGAEQDADDASYAGERDGFEQELNADVGLACANGLAETDFAGALGD